MFREYDFRRLDIFFIVLIIALTIIGVIAIKSATMSNIHDGTDIFVKKQIIGLVSGFVIMIIVALIDYRFISKFYWPIYILNIVLLVSVIFFGRTVNNATRWISIGGFNLQPSEFCKIFLIIFLAKLIDKNKERINKPIFLVFMIGLISLPMYLIYKQPNLSTSLVIIAIFGVILFISGLSYKYIIGTIAILIPCFIIGFWYIQQPNQILLEDYQVKRIMTAVYPEKAETSDKFQTNNSIQAIGSGKLFGKGLYQGKLNQYNYLPEPQTDFIYSIVGEEFGFVGCSTILTLLLVLIMRCLWIAKDTKDLSATIMVIGFVTIISFQTFINVGVVTGILPNTGIPLPFISYGISSLWSNMIGAGLVLNISMQRKAIYY
ncbi:MAG: rod shape-determining protein RodA [Firmicutes bacterium HGW-Firmicutes-1]|jgi:rod shape determining protein RodA|nr:MAG: rod shape-determining protein RodA [Firmicutes bacterium HGW-Firmicutes-1]